MLRFFLLSALAVLVCGAPVSDVDEYQKDGLGKLDFYIILLEVASPNDLDFCQGTLIAHNALLAPASCFSENEEQVILVHVLAPANMFLKTLKDYTIMRHPGYDEESLENNVVIIHLEETFSPILEPIQISHKPVMKNEKLLAINLGVLDEEEIDDTPLFVNLVKTDAKKCEAKDKDFNINEKICAIMPKITLDEDSSICMMNQGLPIYSQDRKLVGIGNANMCQEKYVSFTKISKISTWDILANFHNSTNEI